MEGMEIPKPLRTEMLIEELLPDDLNPNTMSEREFNLLVQNMQEMGVTDAPLVWKRPDGKHQIVGGHHRVEAAKVLGMTSIPVTVIVDPNFSEERAHFQLMRHNNIKGKLSAQKFVKLYERYSGNYSREQLTELFGFEEQAVLDKLVKETEKGLPKELKQKFKEASAEIKTIDDLSKVLNQLFASYGSTLPYCYMVVDFGGKQSVWLRMHPADRANFDKLAARCMLDGKSVDGAVRVLLQLIASGTLPQFESAFDLLPKIQFQDGKLPLEDNEVASAA